MTDVEPTQRPRHPELLESYYHLGGEDLAFFKEQTGIDDEAALKQHIMKVQEDAYQVKPYPCIRWFTFTEIQLSRLPAYQQLLQLGRERGGAIFLDIGCCFGNDVRKAIADGYPRQNCVASDIEPALWEHGYHLFKDSPETFPAPFVGGDALDPSFLKPVPPLTLPLDTPAPALSSLTTLNPLAGHVSAIHISAVFHLFDEQKQLLLARNLAGLLSPRPGSMILGWHAGLHKKDIFKAPSGSESDVMYMDIFCHSPQSWVEMWDGEVFPKGMVRVEAGLKELIGGPPRPGGQKYWKLVWSVTRL